MNNLKYKEEPKNNKWNIKELLLGPKFSGYVKFYYHKEKINGNLNETVDDEGNCVTLAQLVAEYEKEHGDGQNYRRTSIFRIYFL